MDPPGELAQLGEGSVEILARAVEQALGLLRVGSRIVDRAIRMLSASDTRRCWAPSWRSRSTRRRSAYPASTMRVRDARSSSDARPQLGVQPRVLQRQRRGVPDRAEQLAVRVSTGIVDHRRDGAAVELDRRCSRRPEPGSGSCMGRPPASA